MADLTKLSPKALSAAARGGTAGWGKIGSTDRHVRYSEPLPKRPVRRRKCHCGCDQRVTHACMANGLALGNACEMGAARWVRTGWVKPPTLPRCMAARDGDCSHALCPQLRDGEPAKSGRHCPLDTETDEY